MSILNKTQLIMAVLVALVAFSTKGIAQDQEQKQELKKK